MDSTKMFIGEQQKFDNTLAFLGKLLFKGS